MPETRLIDSCHLGLDRVIGVYERDGVLIDPGPSSSIDTVLEQLERPPRALLLTHIHLDHAGASGTLVERFPEIVVHVHEVGAPHLVDPERLLKSAGRLYEDMDALWGPVLPVPESAIRIVGDGDVAEGLAVLETPGHASHHVSYLDPDTGDAFVGDVGGVRIPPSDRILAPTPPPEIDLATWRRSLAALRDRDPARLLLTHFGPIDDAAAQLDRIEAELGRISELARGATREPFLAAYEAEIGREEDGVAARMREAVPPEHVWLGLERYWSKQDA